MYDLKRFELLNRLQKCKKYHKSYYLLEDTLLEGDTLELVVDILDLDILVVVGCMEEAEDTETEQNQLKVRKKMLITW